MSSSATVFARVDVSIPRVARVACANSFLVFVFVFALLLCVLLSSSTPFPFPADTVGDAPTFREKHHCNKGFSKSGTV